MRTFYGVHDVVSLYDHIEHAVWVAICRRFDLPTDLPACVHHADMVALATERRDLMPAHAGEWECLSGIEPAAEPIIALPPSQAAILYSSTLFELLATTHRSRAPA